MRVTALLFLAFSAVVGTARAQITEPPADTTLWAALLGAEDARADDARALDPIVRGIQSTDPVMQRLAVRALGRFEEASLVPAIGSMLAHPHPGVRAEAANAMGQAVQGSDASYAAGPLLARLRSEPDPAVRGVIAQTLGRLPYRAEDDVRRAEEAIRGELADPAPEARLGAARGVESLLRRNAANFAPTPLTVARLRELALQPGGEPDLVRRLALAGLTAAGRLDSGVIATVMRHPEVELRRIAVSSNAAADSVPWVLSNTLTADPAPRVRYAALATFGRRRQARAGCAAVVGAAGDRAAPVALLALDLLGNGCGAGRSAALATLVATARRIPTAASDPGWHQPAHALVALARLAPDSAEGLLPLFAGHGNWFVRMYAARAAGAVKADRILERLARDSHDNVREAAVTALRATRGHAADSAYRAQLTRRDYQLLITAAQALDSTPQPEAAISALLDAFDRVSAEDRETSRDARRALLERVGQLGGVAQLERLRPYLTDFDTLVAREVSEILTRWSGFAYQPDARPLPPVPVPRPGELMALAAATPLLHLSGGGEVALRLRPYDAPTNTARFARLARAGYFDGLTFHRVAPNFVVQGGSPGANEYWGDGPYTRDELTMRPHVRGTVGISTRGRDTGDGQIFINLIDNWRLDHNYTIIGEITSGMDVVDAMLEGAVIERVEWRSEPSGEAGRGNRG